MNACNFETVGFQNLQYPAKVFITSIQNSSFHWHYEYECIVVLKGSVTVSMNPKPFLMKKNDIVFLNSKSVHEISCTSEPNICMILQLDPSLFICGRRDRGYYRFYLNSVLKSGSGKKEYRLFIKQLAHMCLLSLEKKETDCFRLRAEIYTFVADLFSYVEHDRCISPSNFDNDANRLIKAVDFLKEHINDKNITDSLASELGMSGKTLHVYLMQSIGMSAKEVIDNLRTDKAKILLKNTDKKMNCIMDECGFGSENTFYRIFKKNTGITPLEYRMNGVLDNENQKIKGYLNFEESEAKRMLYELLEEQA